MNLLTWIVCLIGHIGFWCVVFNRVHATAFPRRTRKLSEKFVILAVGLPILWVASLMLLQRDFEFDSFTRFRLTWIYLYGAVLLGVFFMARWVWRKFYFTMPSCVVSHSREWISIGKEIDRPIFHGAFAKLMGRVPFNEASELAIERMTFRMPIPMELDGLKICQLSDLHFTGQISLDYFRKVIEYANAFDPDIVVITGDLVDEAKCIDWLDETVGKLRSRCGVFYVLGNHDLRIDDETGLRTRLQELGLVQVSGTWNDVQRGGSVIRLTGNELPWFDDANRLPDEPDVDADLRILMSHSPDQLDWAKPFNFDLMFAGHTHGGQIALPFFGPIVAPSKYGVLYASGTFSIGRMLMHVSRGISGDEPIRICSPPELGLFTLVAEK
ncbi:MAG: metallophosphoesterase [Planctomycetota bacterium]